MIAEWVKYYGTCTQQNEINSAKNGYKLKWKDGGETVILSNRVTCNNVLNRISYYLICQPLPHAEMRARHAMTGEAVEYYDRFDCDGWKDVIAKSPNWNDSLEYQFKLPQKEKIYYRNYKYKDIYRNGDVRVGVVYVGGVDNVNDAPNNINPNEEFIQWLGDTQEVEV